MLFSAVVMNSTILIFATILFRRQSVKFDLITCVLAAMLLVNVRNTNSDWLMVVQKLDRMKSYLNHSKRFGEITLLNFYIIYQKW